MTFFNPPELDQSSGYVTASSAIDDVVRRHVKFCDGSRGEMRSVPNPMCTASYLIHIQVFTPYYSINCLTMSLKWTSAMSYHANKHMLLERLGIV